jgi:S1-C subfamily serine protease
MFLPEFCPSSRDILMTLSKSQNFGVEMLLRTSLLLTKIIFLALILPANIFAQDIGNLKPGVVRIQNDRTDEVGTGFIVKVDGPQIFVLTAAHVVKGHQHPRVYLFNQRHDALQADVLDREDNDTKGLALLRLRLPSKLAAGITALKLGYTSQLNGGENIKVIGFPNGTEFSTVGSGSVARIEGRNLVFEGTIRGGNSGGPVIHDGLVIGMVTDVSQTYAYAARAEALEPYVNGIVPNLISFGATANRQSNLWVD